MADTSRRDFLSGAGLAVASGFVTGPVTEGRASHQDPGNRVALPVADPRDLPTKDRRLEVRGVNTARFPSRIESRAKWEMRAPRLREQILASAGLLPSPTRTPLRAQIFDRIEKTDYSIEKVYFESYPRFFCTGNLYRPLGGSHKPPFPGVLCPHGHWLYGRLENCLGDGKYVSVPQRCMNFALQGYVSFSYDMVGYNDSFQVPHDWESEHDAPWRLTPEGLRLNLWGVSLLNLQLWNSIRALDFLLSLPDVDPQRIAVTGASGGGSQTLLLTAVDDRPRVIAPVNMISHYHQGGCQCENAPSLRIDTDNVEIASLAAPRPLLMVSATGDWTRNTPRVEFPAVHTVYELLGVPDKVSQEQFPFAHNYCRSSREAVYGFFARWLAKEPGKAEVGKVEEKGEVVVDPGRLLVFNRRQPPSEAVDARQLADYLVSEARHQLQAAHPHNLQELESYRRQFGPVFRTAVMVESPSPDDLRWWRAAPGQRQAPGNRGEIEELTLRRVSAGDRVPAQLAGPVRAGQTAALIIHPEGSAAALGTLQSPAPLAGELRKRGCMLLSVDTFQTGAARDAARKEEGTYFSTYNRTDTVLRVQDILTALVYMEAAWHPKRIVVVGQGMAGLWCLLARPFFPEPLAVAADVDGFDSGSDEAYLHKLHVPLLRRAGDFQTAALLAADSPLLLHNLGQRFSSAGFTQTYALHNTSQRLHISKRELPVSEIADWLMGRSKEGG